MQRKKGQFTSAKKQEDASSGNADQSSGPDDALLETLYVLVLRFLICLIL